MPLTSKKEHFLVNSRNKQKIIFMLSDRFEDNSIKTIHATSDADLLICQTAVDSTSRCRTTLMGEDTDLLVLSCKTQLLDLYFRSEAKQITKKRRIWNIKWLQQALGPDTCQLLPFILAISGCDTTSRLFGIGKGVPLTKLKSNPDFKQKYSPENRQGMT